MPFMMNCGLAGNRSAAALASTRSVTSPLARSIPAMAVVHATLAHTLPPDQARSFSHRSRVPACRTLTTSRGASVSGSRRTSSLVPSLVTTSASGPFPVAQIPQPSRL
jgi:hypothetical protein